MRRGPAPKPDDQRARRNKPEVEWTDLGTKPVARPPALPGAARFSADTRRWYRAWKTAPQASQFTATDWLHLHMLAGLVDEYFREPTPARWSAIEHAHAKVGGTIDDRMRLRLRVQLRGQQDEPAAAPADAPARASRPRSGDPRLKLVEESA